MRRSLLAAFAFILALGSGMLWLTHSERGLRGIAALIASGSGGRLSLNGVSGTLLGPLQIDEMRWQTPDLRIAAKGVAIDWSPGRLLERHLQIDEIRLDSLSIEAASSETRSPPPTDLTLPGALAIDKIAIGSLNYGSLIATRQLSGRLSSDGKTHQLTDFQASSGETSLNGQVRLDGKAPFALSASAEATGQLEQHPLKARLTLAGTLEKISLEAHAETGLQGMAQAVVTPFAPEALASASLALDELNPAAWLADAPSARLRLRAMLTPQAKGVGGQFSVLNLQPGPLDQQRLPLERLSSDFSWQGEQARFNRIEASLPGQGKLAGQAEWADQTLKLSLQASQLDAARIVSRLRPTRLAGPLSAELGAKRQSLRAQLADTRFQLQLDASHADGRIELDKLALSSGKARLLTSGKLALSGSMDFAAEGEVQHFDPSQFAQLPAAQINAQFAADGRLAPHTLINARFDLHDSQLAGQLLSGNGRLSVDWPRIPRLDLQLAAGPNRLNANGAFGRAGDSLAINLDAPKLDAYGLEGGLTGAFKLGGTSRQATLSAKLDSPKIGRRGLGKVHGLSLKAELAGQADAALRLDILLGRLDSADQQSVLRNFKLHAEGSRQAHRLEASARLAGRDEISLALNGGLFGELAQAEWRGQLNQLKLGSEQKLRSFSLTQPATLAASRQAWRIGPLQLAGEMTENSTESPAGSSNWQASLQAEASQRQLKASINGQGPRLGQVSGQFEAGLHGAWQLNRSAPWQGNFQTNTDDLGWLGDFIGERTQSAGRLKGRIKLAGSPARPLISGQFTGEALSLRLPDQGLQLTKGELELSMTDNLLRVRKLAFDSPLQPLPRPLQRIDDDTLQQLNKRPGHLEISGEMQVDQNSGFLDIRLDRLGLYQLPEQWVAVSGEGRLALRDTALAARGKLTVDAGYWQLAQMGTPRLSDDVVIKSSRADEASSKPRPRLDLDLTTDFGKFFLFRGAGLSSRLAGEVRLRAEGRDLPRASGTIRMRDGRFEAYGQQLSIARGSLSFQGLLDNPALDVRAIRTGLAVEPGVQISGTAQKPVIRLISDPELPDAEKLAWLVLGHGPEQVGSGDASVLLSAAGGLLGNDSGGLVQQLKGRFGIDEFGVRSGQLGDSGGRTRTSRVAGSGVDTTSATGSQILSVGKRLSSNAVLSYEQALGKAEGVVKLTVSLNRQISVIGRAGSDNALDLFYTLTFGREENTLRK